MRREFLYIYLERESMSEINIFPNEFFWQANKLGKQNWKIWSLTNLKVANEEAIECNHLQAKTKKQSNQWVGFEVGFV